jgi:hypothetical protein
MTQLVVAAAVQATPVFLDRYTTVEKVVELTAKKGARLPAATVDSSPMSARRSTTGPGASLPRIDAVAKATGTAPYAYEQPVTDPLYLHPVQASIARGRVTEGLLTWAILNILEQLRGTVRLLTEQEHQARHAPRASLLELQLRIGQLLAISHL